MADVFVSYSSTERERAKLVADSLTAAGFSVWWDRALKPGETFDAVIQQEISQAKAIVVLWTAASVESQWVREEADYGRRKNALVPLLMDKIEPPIGFGRVQCAALHDWDGDPKHHDWTEVVESIEKLVGQAAIPARNRAKVKPSPTAQAPKKGPNWLVIGLGGAVVALIGLVFLLVGAIEQAVTPAAVEALRNAQTQTQAPQSAPQTEPPAGPQQAQSAPAAAPMIQPAPIAPQEPYAAYLGSINPGLLPLQAMARANNYSLVCQTPQGQCVMNDAFPLAAPCYCPSVYGPVTGIVQ